MRATSNTYSVEAKKLTDEEIVEQIRLTNDQMYISILYDRFSNKIYRRAISFVKEANLAQDLTHDVFMKVLLNIASFKGKSKFSTWVYSITYNYCIDYLRKRQKERIKANNYSNETKGLDEDDIEEFESLREMKVERLMELLEKVTDHDKMILLMKYQDNMSIKDIQGVFDISESAVKMRINRAKGKIKKLYVKNYRENYK